MQSLGQIQIFYKLGQDCLTQTKCDPDDLHDLSRFPAWYMHIYRLQMDIFNDNLNTVGNELLTNGV